LRLYWKSQIEDGSFTEKVKRDALLTHSLVLDGWSIYLRNRLEPE
jgi:hypothetical protein